MQLLKNGMLFRLQGRMRCAFIKMSAASEIKHMSCQNNLFLKYNSLPGAYLGLSKNNRKWVSPLLDKNLQMSAKPLKHRNINCRRIATELCQSNMCNEQRQFRP